MSSAQTLLAYQFPAHADQLCSMREQLREVLTQCCRSEIQINCIILAVGEACMNIIQHAYGKEECGDIILEVENQDDTLLFRLTDFAHHKTQLTEMNSRPLDEVRPGGLGCHLINEIMDEVSLIDCDTDNCGNVLQMKKCIKNRT